MYNHHQFQDTVWSSTPANLAVLNGYRFMEHLSVKLRAMIDAYWSRKLGPEALPVISTTAHLADRLIDSLRQTRQSEADKLQIANISNYIYQQVCAHDLRLGQPAELVQKAFYYSEKNKAAVLTQSLSEVEATKFAGIPTALIDEERNYRRVIAHCNKQLAEWQLKCPKCDSVLIRKLMAEEGEAKQGYFQLKKQLEQQFPEYYALKYQQRITHPEHTQQVLQQQAPQQAIISYSISTSGELMAFSITGKSVETLYLNTEQQIKLTGKTLNDWIKILRKQIIQSRFGLESPTAYAEAAYQLYRLLLQPLKAQIAKHTLVIVPNGPLHQLPFEALITQQPPNAGPINYNTLPYVMKAHPIQYAFSVSMYINSLSDQAKRSQTSKPRLLAFAPGFLKLGKEMLASRGALTNDSTIDPLPATLTEVAHIQQQFTQANLQATIFTESLATESQLWKLDLSTYTHLHFATHAIIDQEKPELSHILLAAEVAAQDSTLSTQYDQTLTGQEMYNLRLNADVVVLSACETAKGKMTAGEGMIGLTRGLMYAGARNIVVSQWKVNDESTADLMVQLYNHQLKGENLVHSLQQAKTSLIANPKWAAPFYWAPFVLICR